MQYCQLFSMVLGLVLVVTRDCNPGLEFSIPGFGIVEFPIPGSRRDWRSIVKTTKIATWVRIFGLLFLDTSVYARAMDLMLMFCKTYRNILLYNTRLLS